MFKRMLVERGYGGVTRKSVVATPEFKQKLTLNGQDVGQLFVDVLDHSAANGYMAYRTVHVFPQAGQAINKAIEAIATGQQAAKDAMVQAQANLVADLKRAGVRL
jgi:multiple sugar transport system substrate-binding protein